MQDAKPNSTPMATCQPLSQFDREKLKDPHLFRSIVGAL
jgi:hypothetical protein